MQARQWAEAERLQRVRVEWNRQRAASALAAPPNALDDAQRHVIRTLAVSVEQLGHIQREQGKRECVTAYEEAANLLQRIGNKPEAIVAFNLGCAYMDIPALRDLAQAERWYRRALELFDERDHNGRARALGQLGLVACERFQEAHAANKPEGNVGVSVCSAVVRCHRFGDRAAEMIERTRGLVARIEGKIRGG